MTQSSLQPPSEKLRKAVSWVSEETLERPEKPRIKILKEAELRFDLTPLECEFLDRKFSGQGMEEGG